MKIEIVLTLLLVMGVFSANFLPVIAAEGRTKPAIVSHETVNVSASVENTVILSAYDTVIVVEFTVEKGKEVKVNYKLDSENEGFGVSWDLFNKVGYEGYLNEGWYHGSDWIDHGVCNHTTKTMLISEPSTYYFVIGAVINVLHRNEDVNPVIHYNIEIEDMTPIPAPTPMVTPTLPPLVTPTSAETSLTPAGIIQLLFRLIPYIIIGIGILILIRVFIYESFEKLFVKREGREEEETHSNLDLEEYEEKLKEEGVKMYIKAAELAGLNDVRELKKEIYAGNILILDISQTKKDKVLVEKAIKDLKMAALDIGGDIAGIGDDQVIVAPKGVKIDREKLGAK